MVTTGTLFAQDAGADIRVTAGNHASIAGAIRADDQLQLSGGNDQNAQRATSIVITATQFRDENGEQVFDSGGLLDTNAGGTITLSATQAIEIAGTVGNVFDSGGSPQTNVSQVNITSAEAILVTGLVNARDQIDLNADEVLVALDGQVVARDPGSGVRIDASDTVYVLKSPTTENRARVAARSWIDIDAAYVLVGGTLWGQDDDAVITVNTQKNSVRSQAFSSSSTNTDFTGIDITGIVDAGDRIEFTAGETNASGDFLADAAGSIRIISAGQLLAAGLASAGDAIVLLAANDVDIVPVAQQGDGTLTIPTPFISQQQYVIQEPVGTRQFVGDPATIQVPVTKYFTTTFLKEIGTTPRQVGKVYTTIEVDVDQIGYYDPATGQQREIGAADTTPLLNRLGSTSGTGTTNSSSFIVSNLAPAVTSLLKVGMPVTGTNIRPNTTITSVDTNTITLSRKPTSNATGVTLVFNGSSYSVDATNTYKELYEVTYKPGSGQFYTSRDGKDLALASDTPLLRTLISGSAIQESEFPGFVYIERTDYETYKDSLSLKEYVPEWADSLEFQIISWAEFLGAASGEGSTNDWYVKIPVGALAEIDTSQLVSSDTETYEDVGDTWLETDVQLVQIGWWWKGWEQGSKGTDTVEDSRRSGWTWNSSWGDASTTLLDDFRDTRANSTTTPGFQTGIEKPSESNDWVPWYELEYDSGRREVTTADGISYDYTDNTGNHQGQPVWTGAGATLETHFMNGYYVEVPTTTNFLGSAHLDINTASPRNGLTGAFTSLNKVPVDATRDDYSVTESHPGLEYFNDWKYSTYPFGNTTILTDFTDYNLGGGTYDVTPNDGMWIDAVGTVYNLPVNRNAAILIQGGIRPKVEGDPVGVAYAASRDGITSQFKWPTGTVAFDSDLSSAFDTSWTGGIWYRSVDHSVDIEVRDWYTYDGERTLSASYNQVGWSANEQSRTYEQVQVDYHWQWQDNIEDVGSRNLITGADNDTWNQNLQWENLAFAAPNTTYQPLPSEVPGNVTSDDSPNEPTPGYVRIDEFEDRYHWSWHNVYNSHDILDLRSHLNYKIVSPFTYIYEDRADSIEVTETRSETVYASRTNLQTETVYAPRVLTTISEVSEQDRVVNYGVFDQDSLSATHGSVRIVAGNQVNVRGLVRAFDGSIQIESDSDTNVGGVLPAGASPADTVAAVAELAATQAVTITAAGNINIEQAGTVGTTGTTDNVTLAADGNVVIEGTVNAQDTVTLVADTDVTLNGQIIAGNTIDVAAGSQLDAANAVIVGSGVGNITGNVDGQLQVTASDGDIFLTAGDSSGFIALTNTDISALDEVQLSAPAGSIQHARGRSGITARLLTATAASDITLFTNVGDVDLEVTGAGDITLVEDDGITLTNITTPDGSIFVVAQGAVVATKVEALGDNEITITTIDPTGQNGSDLTLSTVTTGSSGDVTLTVAGALTASSPIVADFLSLTVAGGGLDVDTNVNTLSARTSLAGDVVIDELDAIDLLDVTVFDGSLSLTAGGTITATDVRSLTNADANDINLSTTSGDIQVGYVSAARTTRALMSFAWSD